MSPAFAPLPDVLFPVRINALPLCTEQSGELTAVFLSSSAYAPLTAAHLAVPVTLREVAVINLPTRLLFSAFTLPDSIDHLRHKCSIAENTSVGAEVGRRR